MTTLSHPTAVQYVGQPDAIIAFGTDCWLTRGGWAIPIATLGLPPVTDNDCGTCAGEPIPGVLSPMNDDYGIERCDECERFPGDFEAALALATLIGPDVTVWFFPNTAP